MKTQYTVATEDSEKFIFPKILRTKEGKPKSVRVRIIKENTTLTHPATGDSVMFTRSGVGRRIALRAEHSMSLDGKVIVTKQKFKTFDQFCKEYQRIAGNEYQPRL